MRIPRAWCVCMGAALLAYTGCGKDKATEGAGAAAPSKEIRGAKPPGSGVNAAINKTYAVAPLPNGYAATYSTDATDGKKPASAESCFGFKHEGAPLDVTVDIDLGRDETVAGATLYTFMDKFDEEGNRCNYGADYLEVYGSPSGKFAGEQKLLGTDGEKESAAGQPGKCVLTAVFSPARCRFVRFKAHKNFGTPDAGTDWLFIKEAEVWK